MAFLCVHRGVVGSAEEIINRNVKIISKENECFIVSLVLLGLVAADGILGHVQVNGKPNLRKLVLLS